MGQNPNSSLGSTRPVLPDADMGRESFRRPTVSPCLAGAARYTALALTISKHITHNTRG